jgi:putative transposase
MTAESKQGVPRLRRLDTLYANSPIFFVTACTAGRKAILDNDNLHQAFRGFAAAGEERRVFVGRYVLMPDHFHLFVSLSGDSTPLQKWMKSLKNTLSKALRSGGIPSPHWQKTFFDHALRSGESYAQKWDYVRSNPVRAGLVEDCLAWPYAGEIFCLEYSR